MDLSAVVLAAMEIALGGGRRVEFVGFLLEAMVLPSSDLGPVESLEAAWAAAAQVVGMPGVIGDVVDFA